MTTLIVLLPQHAADGSTEFPYAVTNAAGVLQDHGTAPAALLPQPRGATAEVLAVVPPQRMSWHEVDLPRGLGLGSPKLRAALEGLLEERLLDVADELHMAVWPRSRAGGAAWVAVCQRAWLRSALQVLDAAGRPASRIVAEFAPTTPPQLYATGEAENGTWVVASSEGVAALPMVAASTPLLRAVEGEFTRVAEPSVANLAEQLWQEPFDLQPPAQRWAGLLRSPWDLGQFEFASSGRARALRKFAAGWSGWLRSPKWRPARWGAALLVVANLIGLNAWAWKERAALEAKRQAVRNTLTTTFPTVRLVVDARLQMEREVAALRQRTGVSSGRDLETLLTVLATSFPPGVMPTSIEYASGELRVRGLVSTPDQLAPLNAGLRGQGYAAALQGDLLVITQEDAR